MRKLLPLLLGATLLAGGAASAASRDDPGAQLDRVLAGRVAGTPVDCIPQHQITESHVIPHTAIVYRVGGTLYLQRPRSGADSLDPFATLVTDTHSDQLCSIDTIRVVDLPQHVFRGTLFLDRFVPYTREGR